MKLKCIKPCNRALVAVGKDKGEIHTIDSPKVGQTVYGDFSYTGSLIIQGYENDIDGSSIYYDPKNFSIEGTIEEIMEMQQTKQLV